MIAPLGTFLSDLLFDFACTAWPPLRYFPTETHTKKEGKMYYNSMWKWFSPGFLLPFHVGTF